MKRKLVCLVIVMVICLGAIGQTFALASDNSEVIAPEPRGAITLYPGLDSLGGGRYRARATIETGAVESLSVSFTLYKVVGGVEQYITGKSESANTDDLTASRTVALSSGTYHMYYSGSGNTVSDNADRYYVI